MKTITSGTGVILYISLRSLIDTASNISFKDEGNHHG